MPLHLIVEINIISKDSISPVLIKKQQQQQQLF